MSNARENFAKAQLEKYGWSQGKGLGREEGGITEALKPKLKFNSTGLGYDVGEQFKFHWWDHVFNKAADSLTVRKEQDGSVELVSTDNLVVSTKRPSLSKHKSNFYGGFVKGGTLVGQNETAESDTSDEEDKRDRSLKLSDDTLFKICKGRTAHKGARHGLNMTAKLARVREQELLLMQEWGAAEQQVQDDTDKQQPKKKKVKKKRLEDKTELIADETETKDATKSKKKKSKKGGVFQHDKERIDTVLLERKEAHESDDASPRKKKKKSHKESEVTFDQCALELHATQKKKKKKKKLTKEYLLEKNKSIK